LKFNDRERHFTRILDNIGILNIRETVVDHIVFGTSVSNEINSTERVKKGDIASVTGGIDSDRVQLLASRNV
jgi:3-keto-L-gulonate-6-phosphate decarboxylase